MRNLVFGALCAVLLAGCGGGGGSGSASVPPVSTSPTPAPIQSQSVQRQNVSQALSAMLGSSEAAAYGNPNSTTALSFRRQVMSIGQRITAAYTRGERVTSGARRAASVTYSACSNGMESAIVTVSSTEEQLYERFFYDGACATLREDLYLNITVTGQTSAAGNGTFTFYTTGGTVYDYEQVALSITVSGSGSGAFAIVATDAPNQTSPITAKAGFACGLSTTTVNCGIGAIARASQLNADIGALLSLNATFPASTGNVTVSVSGSGAAYTGALGALDLATAASQPWFTVTNGTQVDAATYNGSLTYTQTGVVVGGTLTLTDAADDATVTIATTGTPATSLTGTVKRTSTGQTLATFTVDVNGNGTVTYSNGVVAQIVNWVVFG
jgi:hypothetical protein